MINNYTRREVCGCYCGAPRFRRLDATHLGRADLHGRAGRPPLSAAGMPARPPVSPGEIASFGSLGSGHDVRHHHDGQSMRVEDRIAFGAEHGLIALHDIAGRRALTQQAE